MWEDIQRAFSRSCGVYSLEVLAWGEWKKILSVSCLPIVRLKRHRGMGRGGPCVGLKVQKHVPPTQHQMETSALPGELHSENPGESASHSRKVLHQRKCFHSCSSVSFRGWELCLLIVLSPHHLGLTVGSEPTASKGQRGARKREVNQSLLLGIQIYFLWEFGIQDLLSIEGHLLFTTVWQNCLWEIIYCPMSLIDKYENSK